MSRLSPPLKDFHTDRNDPDSYNRPYDRPSWFLFDGIWMHLDHTDITVVCNQTQNEGITQDGSALQKREADTTQLPEILITKFIW